MPATVVFDLGDVVCEFLPDRRLAALSAACGLHPKVIHESLWVSGFDQACDRGRYDAETILNIINTRLGCDLALPDAQRIWAQAFEPRPEVLTLAGTLARKAPVALLTDNSALLSEGLAEHLPAVAAVFSTRLFSCELGRLKSDPALYGEAATRLGCAPEALLLVDDSERARDAASQAGWQVLAFPDVASGLPALRERLAGLLDG